MQGLGEVTVLNMPSAEVKSDTLTGHSGGHFYFPAVTKPVHVQKRMQMSPQLRTQTLHGPCTTDHYELWDPLTTVNLTFEVCCPFEELPEGHIQQ
jgi:hypothetical protein